MAKNSLGISKRTRRHGINVVYRVRSSERKLRQQYGWTDAGRELVSQCNTCLRALRVGAP